MEEAVGIILESGKSAVEVALYILLPVMVVMTGIMRLLEAKGVLAYVSRLLSPLLGIFGIPGVGVFAVLQLLFVSFAAPLATLSIMEKDQTEKPRIAATLAMLMPAQGPGLRALAPDAAAQVHSRQREGLQALITSAEQLDQPADRRLVRAERAAGLPALLRQAVQGLADAPAALQHQANQPQHQPQRKVPAGNQGRRKHAEGPGLRPLRPLAPAQETGHRKPLVNRPAHMGRLTEIKPMPHGAAGPLAQRAALLKTGYQIVEAQAHSGQA